MSNTLNHPSHDHPLMLQHVSEKSRQVHCSLCDERTTGPTYGCKDCDAYLHKECAEAPTQIARHPLHPQHPLRQMSSHLQYCSFCDSVQYGGYMYQCQECGFFLGFICAIATLPPDDCQEILKVEYAAHKHPLISLHTKHTLLISCVLCKATVEGEAYFCPECRFFLHKKCLQLPLEIQHPLHTQHPLFPIVKFPSSSDGAAGDYNCDACDASCLLANCNYFETSSRRSYLVFGCVKCDFYLDVTCAVDIVHPGNREPEVVAHEHELARFCVKMETSIPIDCGICRLTLVGECSGCPTCRFFFHANCVKGSESVQYPVHTEHPLTLTLHTKEGKCRSCDCSLHPLVYGCECGFNVHADCALQVLAHHEQGEGAEIQTPWQDHHLVLCHRTSQTTSDVCCACGDIVEGLGYVSPNVSSCGMLLHKSCTKLTSQIDHAHHPHHPLILVPEATGNNHSCDACRQDIARFRFSCSKCSFNLDIKCASRLPMQKHVLHDHELTYFDELPTMQCNVCGERRHSALFRCVPCDFNIHQECMSLPESVDHKSHWHTLFLRDSYIEDDSGEYYCDICEDRRHPDLGAYVCRGCKSDNLFIAHIGCALSREMFLRTSADPALWKLDERIGELEGKLVELEFVKKELEEAKKERAELVSKQQTTEYSNLKP